MDAELVERAVSGDREAFGRLIERHYDFVHAVAWRWSGNEADAEDIAQEVCIRLGSAIRGFRGTSRFRTWLYALTLNAARDHRRRRARDERKMQAYASDSALSAMSDGDDEERREALWAAVRALPEKQCDAVLLVYAEGLSHAAAADVLGCSEATISWHVHEARKRLRTLLGKEAV
ncbi:MULTISPECIES: RNA polymerase sigma factor [Sinorhizobium]|uniref:RNA polymerase subunit sigma-70 n=2 Tax=Sinorhizobium TaxID=28105 RepID=A0A2S3YPP6_9HYPH|nr:MULTISPECIES: RNA polymerase sigma factor [Sinorhizobium]AUX76746.1 RNA polymerase sigma factor protein [Sinorhizobium fredii]PDT42957.1 RNA polymerase subunit sigma-70 [Sinorhizobium sp. FG01]PDT54741.1 RNA polymerase subunit sigma-70 [Sinorhizobium sp. NG07B]POH31785.1 RNA polymerase subunit sigma-70 [Sinorhizobium americanum]POH32880.1 RNA polymerase subunit sigma-70 [Sinorhizobium americanum]